MLDLSQERLLSRSEAAQLLRVSLPTLDRYRRGSAGVRLEGLRIGGRWKTSAEACQRFADRLTARESGEPVRLPSEASMRRAEQRAVAILQSKGLLP